MDKTRPILYVSRINICDSGYKATVASYGNIEGIVAGVPYRQLCGVRCRANVAFERLYLKSHAYLYFSYRIRKLKIYLINNCFE